MSKQCNFAIGTAIQIAVPILKANHQIVKTADSAIFIFCVLTLIIRLGSRGLVKYSPILLYVLQPFRQFS